MFESDEGGRNPLWLPPGSVTALLALLIIGSVCAMWLAERDVSDGQLQLAAAVVLFYTGGRTAERFVKRKQELDMRDTAMRANLARDQLMLQQRMVQPQPAPPPPTVTYTAAPLGAEAPAGAPGTAASPDAQKTFEAFGPTG